MREENEVCFTQTALRRTFLIADKKGFEFFPTPGVIVIVFIHNLYRFSEIIFPPQESREVK